MVRMFEASEEIAKAEELLEDINSYIDDGDLSKVKNSWNKDEIRRRFKELRHLQGIINGRCVLDLDRPIPTSGRFAGLKAKFQNLVKKCLRFYIKDLTDQQTQFNELMARYVNEEMNILELMLEEEERLSQETIKL